MNHQLATLAEVKNVIERPDFRSGTFHFQPEKVIGSEDVTVKIRKRGDQAEISVYGKDNLNAKDLSEDVARDGAVDHLKTFARTIGLREPKPEETKTRVDGYRVYVPWHDWWIDHMEYRCDATGTEIVDSGKETAKAMTDKGAQWIELKCKPGIFKSEHFRWDNKSGATDNAKK